MFNNFCLCTHQKLVILLLSVFATIFPGLFLLACPPLGKPSKIMLLLLVTTQGSPLLTLLKDRLTKEIIRRHVFMSVPPYLLRCYMYNLSIGSYLLKTVFQMERVFIGSCPHHCLQNLALLYHLLFQDSHPEFLISIFYRKTYILSIRGWCEIIRRNYFYNFWRIFLPLLSVFLLLLSVFQI